MTNEQIVNTPLEKAILNQFDTVFAGPDAEQRARDFMSLVANMHPLIALDMDWRRRFFGDSYGL